jgi:hypothetical protein
MDAHNCVDKNDMARSEGFGTGNEVIGFLENDEGARARASFGLLAILKTDILSSTRPSFLCMVDR